MKPAVELLADLHRRGVILERHGDRLRYYPADRVTATEIAAMRAEKAALLRLLAEDDAGHPFPPGDVADLRHRYQLDLDDAGRAALKAEAAAGDQLAGWIMRAVMAPPPGEPVAWRIYSRRLDRELWVCTDMDALRGLGVEGLGGLPVILADDLDQLRRMDDRMLARALDVLAAFPGARVRDAVSA